MDSQLRQGEIIDDLESTFLNSAQRNLDTLKKDVDKLSKEAKSNQLSALRLTVNKQNSNTISFYESLGFENKRELVTDIGRGYVMDDFEMIKNLS